MAIYVALLDIHPADRKHFERLLERECDQRKKDSEFIYIDAFGSVEAMLKVPMKYDLFIVDCVDIMLHPTGDYNYEVARLIRNKGTDAPIALCFPEEVSGPVSTSGALVKCIRKPVTSNMLSQIIDWSIACKEVRQPKIELRGDFETYYVTTDEIIYAINDGNAVVVHMTEGRKVNILYDIVELSVQLSDYKCFMDVGRNALINMDRVKDVEERCFVMDGGDMVTFSVFDASTLCENYDNYIKG